MAPAADPLSGSPEYVVYRMEDRGSGLYAVYVQMPDFTEAAILVPVGGLSFTRIRLAAEVVDQLWETRRGATPVGQD